MEIPIRAKLAIAARVAPPPLLGVPRCLLSATAPSPPPTWTVGRGHCGLVWAERWCLSRQSIALSDEIQRTRCSPGTGTLATVHCPSNVVQSEMRWTKSNLNETQYPWLVGRVTCIAALGPVLALFQRDISHSVTLT